MPSVPLAVSVLELQLESEPLAHDLPLSGTPLISMYSHYTAQKCSTHSAQSPGVMPLMPSSISFLMGEIIPRNEKTIKTH